MYKTRDDLETLRAATRYNNTIHGKKSIGGGIMKDCIFCKIIAQEIPGHIIFENEHVLAFLDISQTTKGHTLIIPKKHRVDLFEMDECLMEQVFKVVPKIANGLKATFDCHGLNVVNNNGEVAGQTVFHYHVHLIPRYENDSFGITFPNHMKEYDANALAQLKDSIKENLKK